MNHMSNPTAGAAIGAVDKEIARAKKHAEHLREARENGTLRSSQIERARKRYTGLFRVVFEREFARPPEEAPEETA